MFKKILLSIVVPVYNSAQTLNLCLDSILGQGYENFELILINDGSSDDSLKIIKKYSSSDKRIIVLNQVNKGVSAARNSGIRKSKGDLILFIDSDDTIEQGYFEKVVDCYLHSKADVIFVGYNFIKNSRRSINLRDKVGCLSDAKSFEFDLIKLVNNKLFLSTCSKAYSLSLVKNNKLFFDDEVFNGEDLLFNIDFFKYVNKYEFINECYYNYIIKAGGSLSQSVDVGRIKNNAKLIKCVAAFCRDMDLFNGGLGIFAKYYFKSQLYAYDLIASSGKLSKAQTDSIIHEIFSLDETKLALSTRSYFNFDIEWLCYRIVFSIESKLFFKLMSMARRSVKVLVR